MTHGIDMAHDFTRLECGRVSRKIFSQTLPGAAALASSVLVGVWMLYLRPPAAPHVVAAPEPARNVIAQPKTAPAATVAENPYGALFDPGFLAGSKAVSLAQSFPLESNLESIEPTPPASSVAMAEPETVLPTLTPEIPQSDESAPLPTPRPAELGGPASQSPFHASGRRLAQENRKAVLAAAPPDNRSFFEKLFGAAQQPTGQALAYAAPEDGLLGKTRAITATATPTPRNDKGTAIYDISAHTVYMPDGTRLEAHSGLGDRLDDPRYVSERMRGPTPPNVYELAPREQLFHGVRALRLTPIGGSVYGRTGLLAHTFMLGPKGDSNGCVSFRNYNAFLRAYETGEIRRLVVVARMN